MRFSFPARKDFHELLKLRAISARWARCLHSHLRVEVFLFNDEKHLKQKVNQGEEKKEKRIGGKHSLLNLFLFFLEKLSRIFPRISMSNLFDGSDSIDDFDLLWVIGGNTSSKVFQVRKRQTKEIFALK